jgi:hypothetical protein
MLIPVIYRNGNAGMVTGSRLEKLVRFNRIEKFLRLEGWVTVGIDPLRHSDRKYEGRNKRGPFKHQ